ncbi:hypothetical protein ASPCAL12708 [Aspergillus calidoustus]|uniref:Chromosome segregation protein BIR1 n=1 Tax=Aspergillus calidoustus TaxID=454130 RepID=A0A0U4ZJ45_ASPCI|nr:hypothetical protein ASPCAL12708 [Aspergillus calidoustus]
MANDMELFAARLASFDTVIHPDRRSSSSRSAKPISWPHSSPSPAELAHAGFYYNPYETNPDNTTCFLCRRALDGWEEEDDPITEHLKHTKDCGWAIMMDIHRNSSNPAEIEDPTSETIAQARLATFGESWPHDGKKGWLCQSDKMVEGGWYFCPNEESADMASCAYCKLSLDCWEPKDNPFDEHYRRSPKCSFFVFAKLGKGKGSRSKKGRTSKTSRLSTQSNASEIPVSDVEDQMDERVLAPPVKSKASKKPSKSKAKSTKSKKDEVQETASQMDMDEADFAQPEQSKPKRSTRGTKRSSADFEKDNMSIADGDSVGQPEPPAKKRATKSRTSRARSQSVVSTDAALDVPGYESDATQHEEQRPGRTSKKKGSNNRKASVSSTSKSTKSRVPRDSELDAAIEAGLEADDPQNMEVEEAAIEKTPPKASKKSKSKKKAAKKDPEPPADVADRASVFEAPVASKPAVEQNTEQTDEFIAQQEPMHTEEKSKPRSQRNSVEQLQSKRTSAAQEQSTAQTNDEENDQNHDSFISVEIVSKPPAEYSVLEPTNKDSKKSKKKASSEKPKKSKKAEKADKNGKSENPEKASKSEEAEEQLQKRTSMEKEIALEQSPLPARLSTPEPKKDELGEESSHRRSSRVPPKTAERYSDIPHEKQYAKSLVESQGSDRADGTRRTSRKDQEDEPMSPLPPASRGSPSLSPQSSDAENHPPSMNFSVPRPQLSSPSKKAHVRIPLAASTPSPSKRNASAQRVHTSHPWVPVDIDEILLVGASDKENVDLSGPLSNAKNELSSPEKKMTVEEWIMWNAKNGEERLKRECERLVGQFEREGARAMRALEGIECID